MTAGRLAARPAPPTEAAPEPGLYDLELDGADVLLHVPPGTGDGQHPLVVLLHGAGGTALQGLQTLSAAADQAGLVLLSPSSVGVTWDLVHGGFGADVDVLDAALARVFACLPVDRGRIAVGGFSDGASYALSVGLTNGDLFTRVVAFSPGFAMPADEIGSPSIFVSHGTNDSVLPIDVCSRRVVPSLRRSGYSVEYVEFEGGHEVPAAIVAAALAWLTEPPG